MTRVMIALDGSDLDQRVAPVAHRLFGEDAEYLAVNVRSGVDPGMVDRTPAVLPVGYGGVYPYRAPDLYAFADTATASEMSDEVERSAREAANAAGMDDADVVGEIGEPEDAILRAAREHDADVIVVGTHDRGWWSKLVRPSVSDGLIDDSTIPVLLVSGERDGNGND